MARLRAAYEKADEERKSLGVSDEVAEVEGLTGGQVVLLGQAGVKSLDDLADLDTTELRVILADQDADIAKIDEMEGAALAEVLKASPLSEDEANEVIMAARAHWFEDEPAPEAEAVDGAETSEEEAEA